jgi:hypothetical protein
VVRRSTEKECWNGRQGAARTLVRDEEDDNRLLGRGYEVGRVAWAGRDGIRSGVVERKQVESNPG